MDYKAEVIKYLGKFRKLLPREIIKLDRYFLEYTRQLAVKAKLDPIKDYKRTSILIDKYNKQGYECLGKAWTIISMYKEIVISCISYPDVDTMIQTTITPEEQAEIDCLLETISKY